MKDRITLAEAMRPQKGEKPTLRGFLQFLAIVAGILVIRAIFG